MATLKEYVDGFSYYESTGLDVQRKFLAHYVDVSTTGESPDWELLGYKVEDASIEYNWDEEKITDITGVTYSSITKSEPEMSLDGYIVNTKSKFLKTLSSMAIRNAYEEFGTFTVLTVYSWLTTGSDSNSTPLAKKETGCTIKPDSLGGQGYTRITPTISFSNNAEYGTVTMSSGKPTFTKGTYTD